MDERINQLLTGIKGHINTNNKRVKKIETRLEEIIDLRLPDDAQLTKLKAADCMKDIIAGLRASDIETVTWRRMYDTFANKFGYVLEIKENEALLERVDVELEAIDFEAGFTEEGWVYVSFPSVYPEYDKLFLSRQFLEPVGLKLALMSNGNFFTKEKCVICVVRYLNPDNKISPRDSDNINYNNLTNLLSRAFLVDDSPEYCDFSYHSVFSSEPHIEAFIVPLKTFPDFARKLADGTVTSKKSQQTADYE